MQQAKKLNGARSSDLVENDDDQEIEGGGGHRDGELDVRLGIVIAAVQRGDDGDAVNHHGHHGHRNHQQLSGWRGESYWQRY